MTYYLIIEWAHGFSVRRFLMNMGSISDCLSEISETILREEARVKAGAEPGASVSTVMRLELKIVI